MDADSGINVRYDMPQSMVWLPRSIRFTWPDALRCFVVLGFQSAVTSLAVDYYSVANKSDPTTLWYGQKLYTMEVRFMIQPIFSSR